MTTRKAQRPRACPSVSLEIADDLRQRITSGELGGQLPTQRTLARQYGTSQTTINRAMRLLRQEGLITSFYGAGSFTDTRKDARDPLLSKIIGLLCSGNYAPGDPFPTELALCRRFHVCQTTLRIVVRKLEDQGFIGRASRSPAHGRIVLALPQNNDKGTE